MRWRNHENHAHAHVERAVHLFIRHVAQLLYNPEDRQWAPTGFVDDNRDLAWQQAGDVGVEPAAGNVGERVDSAQQRIDQLEVRAVRPQQLFPDWPGQAFDSRTDLQPGLVEYDAAR